MVMSESKKLPVFQTKQKIQKPSFKIEIFFILYVIEIIEIKTFLIIGRLNSSKLVTRQK